MHSGKTLLINQSINHKITNIDVARGAIICLRTKPLTHQNLKNVPQLCSECSIDVFQNKTILQFHLNCYNKKNNLDICRENFFTFLEKQSCHATESELVKSEMTTTYLKIKNAKIVSRTAEINLTSS